LRLYLISFEGPSSQDFHQFSTAGLTAGGLRAGGLAAVATAGWAAAGLSTVGWAAAGGLGMVQLAAGWG
jgi:hypothetical protein